MRVSGPPLSRHRKLEFVIQNSNTFIKMISNKPTNILIHICYLIILSNYFPAHCSSESGHNSNVKLFLGTHRTLQKLAFTEHQIYDILKSQSESKTSFKLNRYLEDFEDNTGRLRAFSPESLDILTANHPLLSYRLLRRYAHDLKDVVHELLVDDALGLGDVVRKLNQSVGWPDVADVRNSIIAILRIQLVYDHQVAELALLNSDDEMSLRGVHFYEIGKVGVQEGYLAYAIEWLEFAKLVTQAGYDHTGDLELINEWLELAIEIHDQKVNNPNMIHDNLLYTHLYKGFNHSQYSTLKRRNYYRTFWKGRREENFNTINFWSLCSGEDLRTEEEKSNLFCWYERSKPAWYISPLKMERLSNELHLVQIYEVLTNNLIEKLINSIPNMEKSGLFGDEGIKHTLDRTSFTSWVDDIQNSELTTIPRRIELITGLNVLPRQATELLQVATYSFGGHYEVHQDVLKYKPGHFAESKGDRIATFMIYLNDVELGGFTAFPQAGIAVKPVKGSAVFWYNMKRNGEPDDNTWHGACPVIYGNKWVANKWIHINEQHLTRPCTLNSEE